jgi:type IV pilus assembly protein PilX
MLAHRFPNKRFVHPANERGVVLMISLIILVALTIAGIALIRSVDTTNIISGNLAFQQAAVHAAEAGTEEAVRTFLETSTPPIALQNDDLAKGYVASTPASGNPASWDTYWSATINPNPVGMPVAAKTCVDRVCTLATDAAGIRFLTQFSVYARQQETPLFLLRAAQ